MLAFWARYLSNAGTYQFGSERYAMLFDFYLGTNIIMVFQMKYYKSRWIKVCRSYKLAKEKEIC